MIRVVARNIWTADMAAVFDRVVDRLRSRGLWATARRLVCTFVYAREHWLLVYKRMDVEMPKVTARVAGTARLARREDLARLRVFSNHYTEREFQRFIAQGGCLYVFEHEGRLVAYRLVTRELPRFGPARDLIQFEPSDTWVVNAFTLPEFRGARIGAALASHILDRNRAAGFKREISLIRLENEASRKMVGLAGAQEMEEITCTRVLGYKKYRILSTNGRRYYDGSPRRDGPTSLAGSSR